MNSITYTPIGIIHSPFTKPEGMPIQPSGAAGVKGTVVVDQQYVEALADLEGFSHLILIYHFHQAQGYSLKVKPFLDDRQRGLFATRAPRRPNQIGISVIKLCSIEGNTLNIENVDIIDGTPLLDIKPYVPDFDNADDIRIGWLESKSINSKEQKSDKRFL
jgi:tRNA-Thr(GGU) m(6)t(6)A37 methyltransferase TsaA